MIILFLWHSVRKFFPSRAQYAIFGTGILGQIALFKRRVWGAAKTPLDLPYPFRVWPEAGTRAERDKRELRNSCILGGIRPSYSARQAHVSRKMSRRPVSLM